VSHLYEAALLVTPAAGPVPLATILAGSGTRAEVREICVSFQALTTGTNVQLGRPAAAGTGGSSAGLVVQAMDSADTAGRTTLVTTFVTAQPTAPANAMRICRLSAVASGWAWTWEPGELIIPASGQLILWLLSGQGSYDISVKVAE
jgi:hypothetical protein